jgi:hypothetical protein
MGDGASGWTQKAACKRVKKTKNRNILRDVAQRKRPFTLDVQEWRSGGNAGTLSGAYACLTAGLWMTKGTVEEH